MIWTDTCWLFCLQALGGVLAVAIGVAFVAVQVLSHYGVITVHWTNVNEKVVTLVDANADGKLDSSDFRVWGKKLLAVLAEVGAMAHPERLRLSHAFLSVPTLLRSSACSACDASTGSAFRRRLCCRVCHGAALLGSSAS